MVEIQKPRNDTREDLALHRVFKDDVSTPAYVLMGDLKICTSEHLISSFEEVKGK
jgi:hypothetical protein